MCRLNWDNSLYSIFHSSIDKHRLQPTHVPLTIYKVFQPVPDGILIFFDPLKNPIISIFIAKHTYGQECIEKRKSKFFTKVHNSIKIYNQSEKSPYFIIKFIYNEYLEKSDFDKNLHNDRAVYLSMEILFKSSVKSSFKFLSFFSYYMRITLSENTFFTTR